MSDPLTKTLSGIFSALVIGGAVFYFAHDADQRKAERLAREAAALPRPVVADVEPAPVEATAFDGKLSAGYTFEIEMRAQPHD